MENLNLRHNDIKNGDGGAFYLKRSSGSFSL